MSVAITNMCQEVKSEWLSLISDVSASHVMRAVLCTLAGCSPPVEKRGRNGKHGSLHFDQANDKGYG